MRRRWRRRLREGVRQTATRVLGSPVWGWRGPGAAGAPAAGATGSGGWERGSRRGRGEPRWRCLAAVGIVLKGCKVACAHVHPTD